MRNRQRLSALAVVGMTALAGSPSGAGPSDAEGITTPPAPSERAVSKSDEHRIVGKVLGVNPERGQVTLATEEGVVVVEPPVPTLRAVHVGDVVSVPRSEAESPGASPPE
jgi:hypothetical protein